MRKKLAFAAATVFGAGYSPKAPGTVGSMVTLPFVWLAAHYFGLAGLLVLIAVAFVIGMIAIKEVLKHTKHDPSFVVIDEFVGQSIAFTLAVNHLHLWWVWALGFLLFRLFDICKTGPVKWADEKLENAWGVMLDDVFAGMFAAIILGLALYAFGFYQ